MTLLAPPSKSKDTPMDKSWPVIKKLFTQDLKSWETVSFNSLVRSVRRTVQTNHDASWVRGFAPTSTKVLYDPGTEALFLPLFWFLPIYRELLNTASRHRSSRDSELRRSASGLVKVFFFCSQAATDLEDSGSP